MMDKAKRIERKPELIDDARQQVADWNESNPESKIVIDSSQINKRVKQAMMDKAKRIEKTAPKEIRAAVKAELAKE
jgi:flagellar biosynthesis regulator FlaF